MIEISLTEIILLAWAVLATASWINARDDARVAKKILVHFIENKEARDQLIEAHAKFMEQVNRS